MKDIEIYKEMLDVTREGFWVVDNNQITIEVNEALCSMLGYTDAEMVGKTPLDFVDEKNREIFLEQTSKISKSKHRKYPIELTRKDGTNIPTIINATTIADKNGEIVCSFGIITDISEEVRIKKELQEANEKLRASEELVRKVLDSQDSLIVLTDGRKILHANVAFLKFFNIQSMSELEDHDCFCVWMTLSVPFRDDKNCCTNWLKEIERHGWRVDIKDNRDGNVKNFIVVSNKYEDNNEVYVVNFTDVTKLQAEMDYFVHLASTDTLTNLHNRAKLYEMAEFLIEKSKRYTNIPFCIIIYDVDYFKKINDTYGHHKGDLVLQNLAKLMQNNIRSSDFIARYGGEEFIILTPNTNLLQAVILAEKLRAVTESSEIEGLSITCSFGVHEYTPEDSRTTLIDNVDKLLYKAKQNGRNRVEYAHN